MVFQGFTPHASQRKVIQEILTSDAKFHIATIGRQWGKSLMGMNLALYWMINNGPCKVLWVSPVYSQSNKVHKELYTAIAQSGLVKSNNFSANEIELKNGSTILFRSAERYDNIRGLTCDYGIIDEAAFMKSDAWKEAIRPVFAVRGKKVLFISTPKGKNFFYDLYQLGKSPDHPRYKSYTGSSYETPFISKEEIEDAKRTIPEMVFKQEYEAQFIDSGGEVFQNLDRISYPTWSQPEGKVYCGIDLAKQEDYTVATFMDSTGKVIDIYRANGSTWADITREILKGIRKYNATAVVEVNSIGDVIFELLKKEWQDIQPFVTTSKTKQEIIEGLILDVNESNIKIPSRQLFEPLHHEMEIFTYDYNPKTRSIRYGHPTGQHDDTVISLALANWARKTMKSIGTYAVMGKRY
jgi:hypothetical protein